MSNEKKPLAEEQPGGFFQSFNGGLSSALDLWAKVETVKGIKSANGRDQQQAMYKPELANGAAVLVDKDLMQKANDAGFKIDKKILTASLILLGLAFTMRIKGFG